MQNLPKIFIVEDDAFFATILNHEILKNNLGDVEIFLTGEGFMDNLYKMPDIVLLDYNLNTTNGLEVLKKIKSFNPNIKVILISSQDNASVAIKSFKNGAYGYIEKNNDVLKKLNTFINSCVKNHKEAAEYILR